MGKGKLAVKQRSCGENKQGTNTSFFHGVTNPKWLSIKAHYFFAYSGIAAIQPFLVLFYASLGLNTAQIGIIECLFILIGTIARPLIGTIADKSGKHYLVLGLSTMLFILPCAAMAFVPAVRFQPFLLVLTLRSISAIALGPSFSLTDSIAYDMLGPKHRGLWGQQRMFGTLGWGITAGIIGGLIDVYRTFAISFATFAMLGSVTVAIALFWLPKTLHTHTESEKIEEKQVHFGKALKELVASPIFVVDCLVAVASGMFHGITQVLIPQLKDDLDAPKLLFGLSAVTVCAFEIPSLFFAGAVVNKIGEIACFLLMFLAYAARFALLSLLTPGTVWAAVPVEVLHIFCFGFYFPAATRVAAKVAPPGTSSTVQAIIATSYGGIGAGSGILLASLLYQSYGGKVAFLLYAAVALSGFLLLLIAYLVFLRRAFVKMSTSTEDVSEQNVNIPALEAEF